MSPIAKTLIELLGIARGDAGALTQHLLVELAGSLIAPGVASVRLSR
ncbi:hypothetical protein [Paraburkholderia guartelaensis]|nr:hypothetical protein [Paraburkholderia guartelaensis]